MKVHILKTWPEFFHLVKDGKKTFEIRINDRDFQVDDTIILTEYLPNERQYTGDVVAVRVLHIMPLSEFVHGTSNIVVMSIKKLEGGNEKWLNQLITTKFTKK